MYCRSECSCFHPCYFPVSLLSYSFRSPRFFLSIGLSWQGHSLASQDHIAKLCPKWEKRQHEDAHCCSLVTTPYLDLPVLTGTCRSLGSCSQTEHPLVIMELCGVLYTFLPFLLFFLHKCCASLQLESLLFLLHGFQEIPCLVACSFGWWVFSVAVFVPSWFPGQFGKT